MYSIFIRTKMNYLKLVIFVAVTILLDIEAYYIEDPSFIHERWKNKNTHSPTMIKLARESVYAFNEAQNTNYFFESLDSAQKRKEKEPHYKLSISVAAECGPFNLPCTKHLLSDVFGHPKSNKELKIDVEEDENYYPHSWNVF
uniref:Cystatin domain-containing protein n=1 Tax=Strongyloides papillosus TaxID=174720 RepID=A0A0N5B724_STREA